MAHIFGNSRNGRQWLHHGLPLRNVLGAVVTSRNFTERMAAGKQRAMDKRNRGLATSQHSSWNKKRRPIDQADKDQAIRLEHIRAIAAIELFHNTAKGAKAAIEAFCRNPDGRTRKSTDIPF